MDGRRPRRRRSAERRDGGYVLLDVLVTLLIVSIGFAVFLSSAGAAAGTASRLDKRAASLIEGRNADAVDCAIDFEAKE